MDISKQHYTVSEQANNDRANEQIRSRDIADKPWYMDVIDRMHCQSKITDEELISVYANCSV